MFYSVSCLLFRSSLSLFIKQTACLVSAGRVDCGVALLNVADDTFFVHDERGTSGESAFFVKDAVLLNHMAFEIAKQRERDSDILGEAFVAGKSVNTDPEHLRVGGIEFGDSSLIRV